MNASLWKRGHDGSKLTNLIIDATIRELPKPPPSVSIKYHIEQE